MITTRKIGAADCDAIVKFYEKTSFETLYKRFRHRPYRPWELLDYFEEREVVMLAFDGSEVIGIAEVDLQTREFAMIVTDEYQHRGVGSLLFEAIKIPAKEKGLIQLEGNILWSNTPVVQWSRKNGFIIKDLGEGEAMTIYVL